MSRAARIALVVVAAVAAALFFFGGTFVAIATDAAWFDAAGYGSVFTTTLLARLGLGAVAGLAAFAALQANAVLALSRSPGGKAINPELVDNPIGRILLRVPAATLTGIVSVLLALFVGLFLSTQWDTLLLFLNGSSFDYTEPVLGHDASFYVFTLPLIEVVRGTLFSVVVLCVISAAILYAIRGAIKLDVVESGGQAEIRGVEVPTFVKAHLAVLVAMGLLLMAAGSWLARYDLLYDQSGLISGPGSAAHIVNMALCFRTSMLPGWPL